MRNLIVRVLLLMLLVGFGTASAQETDFQRMLPGDTATRAGWLVSDSALMRMQHALAEAEQTERKLEWTQEEVEALRDLLEHAEAKAVREQQWRENATDVMREQQDALQPDLWQRISDNLVGVAGGYLACAATNGG